MAKADHFQTAAAPPDIADHEMLRCIGQGSYGEVWLARNAVGTFRAVKVVHLARFLDARPYEREFAGIQKYEPISRSNDGLVDVLQIGRNDAAGYFYYVMELADDAAGEQIQSSPSAVATYVPKTLARQIHSRGRLPYEECLTLGLTLNLALGHLHRHGLMHRDVKPSNIIFVNGVPKLADIGLVTGLDEGRSFVGTEGFIPPEGPNSPQADIYALGKVLYEAGMGKDRQEFPEPFTRLGLDDESKRLMELNAVLLRACAPKAAERYKTAEEMNADLALLHSGRSVQQKHALERRLRLMTRLGAGAMAVLLLAAFPYYLALREARLANAAAKRESEQFRRAEQAVVGLKRQQEIATGKLWDSYLAQARATRLGGQPGRRFESLALLKLAANIKPSIELRDEAIACMALSDMRVLREWRAGQKPWTALQFDSHYERYAMGDGTGKIILRRVDDGGEIMSLPRFGTNVTTLQFSPDDHYLAARHEGADRPFVVWDARTGAIDLAPKTRYFRGCCFSPDSKLIAVAHAIKDLSDFCISIYDLPSGRETRRLPEKRMPYGLCFNPAGDKIAVTAYPSPVVEIWDVASGEMTDSFSLPAGIRGVDWHPTKNVLVAAGSDARIYVWDIDEKRIRSILASHQAPVLFAMLNHAGDLISSVSWDGNLLISDFVTGRPIFNYRGMESGFRFCQDDHRLGFCPDTDHVGIWEFATNRECRILRTETDASRGGWACAFSPDGQKLASTHPDGIRFWDVETAREVAFVPESNTYAAIFRADTNGFLTSGDTGLKQWTTEPRPKNGGAGWTIGRFQKLGPWKETGFFGSVQGGQTLAVMGETGIHKFNLETQAEEGQLAQSKGFDFVALSPDGKMAAANAPLKSAVRVWSMRQGEVLKDLTNARVVRVCFSPDNQWLVTSASEDYSFWDTSSWTCRHVINRPPSGYFACGIAFSRDGKMAAITLSVNQIQLIDPVTLKEFATLESPESGAFNSLCFSPDGTRLAGATDSLTIQLWDLRLIRQELAEMNLDW